MGDKYMAVSGLPDLCENHAVSIARLALDMIDKADSVMMGDRPIVSCAFINILGMIFIFIFYFFYEFLKNKFIQEKIEIVSIQYNLVSVSKNFTIKISN